MNEEPGTELYAGLVTRGVAFAFDAAVINLAAIATGVVVGLALSVLSIPDKTVTVLLVIGGCLYVLWTAAYFVVFWSTTTGQTVGSRVMQIRVREAQIDRPLPRAARVRSTDRHDARRDSASRGLHTDTHRRPPSWFQRLASAQRRRPCASARARTPGSGHTTYVGPARSCARRSHVPRRQWAGEGTGTLVSEDDQAPTLDP